MSAEPGTRGSATITMVVPIDKLSVEGIDVTLVEHEGVRDAYPDEPERVGRMFAEGEVEEKNLDAHPVDIPPEDQGRF